MVTYLFPNLTFECNGTIVRLIVAMANYSWDEGDQANNKSVQEQTVPKMQIWRKNSDLYRKAGPDIPIFESSCVTEFQGGTCVWNIEARVSVQPGDILGLEIPPTSDDKYKILFSVTNNESNAYIFRHQLPPTVNLSEADSITNHLPQIIPLVILGNYIYL